MNELATESRMDLKQLASESDKSHQSIYMTRNHTFSIFLFCDPEQPVQKTGNSNMGSTIGIVVIVVIGMVVLGLVAIFMKYGKNIDCSESPNNVR